MTDVQCGYLDPHMPHDHSIVEYGDVTCPGISERHCTMELGHSEHAYDEDGSRYWCEGTVALPVPEPSYEERYCRIPGGCNPNHLYTDNNVTYVCPGGKG
jgi:hypothetical protein